MPWCASIRDEIAEEFDRLSRAEDTDLYFITRPRRDRDELAEKRARQRRRTAKLRTKTEEALADALRLAELRAQGMSYRKISALVGRSEEAVRLRLRKLASGEPIRPRGVRADFAIEVRRG